MKITLSAGIVLALLLIGVSVGGASDRSGTAIIVQVTSADHELDAGYFALGEEATVMAKPGSDLFEFLRRQRGHTVKIVLTQTSKRELSRLRK